tara:strand:+ start:321 stop:506 length:186 start_codon:yes stop_codon:yes gene_type:complete
MKCFLGSRYFTLFSKSLWIKEELFILQFEPTLMLSMNVALAPTKFESEILQLPQITEELEK